MEPARKHEDAEEQRYGWDPKVHQGGAEGGGDPGDLRLVKKDSPYDADKPDEFQPHLRSVAGGGLGDGVAKGKLSDTSKRGELEEAEQSAEDGATSKIGQKESGLYNPESSGAADVGLGAGKIRALGIKRFAKKRVATVAIAGILGGGGIFGATILSGPLEIVHFAQLMQRYHLRPNQDQADHRMMKIARNLRYLKNGHLQNVRMGIIGNKITDNIENNLKERAGLEAEYRAGYAKELSIDTDKLKDTQFDEFKNKSPEELSKHLEKRYGAKGLRIEGSKVFFDPDSLSYRSHSKLLNGLMQVAGYRKTTSTVGARFPAKRHGATLHPIRKADKFITKKVDALFIKFLEKRAARINNGEPDLIPEIDRSTPPDETDPAKAAEADAARREAEEIKGESKTAGNSQSAGDPGPIEKLQSKLSFKLAAGLAGATGVLCVLREADDASKEVKFAQQVEPLLRTGTELIGLGNQIMTGDDLTMTQVGFYSKFLHGKDARGIESDWNQAESVRAYQDKDGIEALDSYKNVGNDKTTFSFLNEGEIGGILDKACGKVGSAAMLIVGFIASPFGTVAGGALAAKFGPALMHQAAELLAGSPVDPFAKGADYGNAVSFGSRLLSNAQMQTSGGRELTKSEEAEVDNVAINEDKFEFQNKNIADRVFDVTDSRSVASQFIDNGPQDIKRGVASFFTNPASALASSTFSKVLFGNKVSAATKGEPKYDFGFPKIGYSVGEIDDNRVDNPEQNADIVVNDVFPRYYPPCQPDCPPPRCAQECNEMITKVYDCYGIKVAGGTHEIENFNAQKKNPSTMKDPTWDCNSKDDDWFRIRFYLFDSNVMTSAGCYEGLENYCQEMGFGAGSSQDGQAGAGGGANGGQAGAGGGTVSGDTKSLAQKLLDLEKDGKIVFGDYSENKASDQASRSLASQQIADLAAGKQAQLSTRCSYQTAPSVAVDPKLLSFLVDLAGQTKYIINTLAGQCHSGPNSLHHQGKAVDFGCPLNTSIADSVGRKYGISHNNEACGGLNNHWHYSIGGG